VYIHFLKKHQIKQSQYREMKQVNKKQIGFIYKQKDVKRYQKGKKQNAFKVEKEQIIFVVFISFMLVLLYLLITSLYF